MPPPIVTDSSFSVSDGSARAVRNAGARLKSTAVTSAAASAKTKTNGSMSARRLTPAVSCGRNATSGLRLLRCHAARETPEHVEPYTAPIQQPVEIGRGLPFHHRRKPDRRHLRPVDAMKVGWCDADNRHRMRVDRHLVANDVAAAT